MAKVITRVFSSPEDAKLVRNELINRNNFSSRIVDIYDRADGLPEALAVWKVHPDTALEYQKRVKAGGAVVLVRAGYKPLGVAQTTRNVTAAMGALDLGTLTQEVPFKEAPTPLLSVFQDHRHILTKRRDPDSTNYYMADWPIPLISRRKPITLSLIPPHARMADFILPLISRSKPFDGFLFPRHARMANWPIPLISRRKPYTGSIIARHGRMADFPIRLISQRKPFSATWIGRHTRMANWPFPLLINGKQGANALIPGGPRMANFPIPLLSDRKPFTGSIFGRHARMASFPIPLISHRQPFTGSIFDRHARMANFLLPLTIAGSTPTPDGRRSGFSLSGLFGLPTIRRR